MCCGDAGEKEKESLWGMMGREKRGLCHIMCGSLAGFAVLWFWPNQPTIWMLVNVVVKIIGSSRYGHYRLQTTVIHGEDLVRDLLRMLDSTWVSLVAKIFMTDFSDPEIKAIKEVFKLEF